MALITLRELRGLPAQVVEKPLPDNVSDGSMHHPQNPRTVAPPDGPKAEGTGGMLGLAVSPPINRGRGGKRPSGPGAR